MSKLIHSYLYIREITVEESTSVTLPIGLYYYVDKENASTNSPFVLVIQTNNNSIPFVNLMNADYNPVFNNQLVDYAEDDSLPVIDSPSPPMPSIKKAKSGDCETLEIEGFGYEMIHVNTAIKLIAATTNPEMIPELLKDD